MPTPPPLRNPVSCSQEEEGTGASLLSGPRKPSPGQAHSCPASQPGLPPQCGGQLPGRGLHDALCAFASPDHQRRHEQRHQDGHHNEGAEDAAGRVPHGPAGHWAASKVALVDSDEEAVHRRVRPEAAQLLHHLPGAVCELSVAPADGKAACQSLVGRGRGQDLSGGSPPTPTASSASGSPDPMAVAVDLGRLLWGFPRCPARSHTPEGDLGLRDVPPCS